MTVSVIGETKVQDYEFSRFLDREENSTRLFMLIMYSLVRINGYKQLFEIGTRYGVNTCFLAQAASLNGGHVTTLDISPAAAVEGRRRITEHCLEHLATFLVGDSRDFEYNQPIDFLFIDGNHTYDYCKSDWNKFSRLVPPGGMVAFHDTDDPPVMQVVNEINKDEWDVYTFPGDCGLSLARRR